MATTGAFSDYVENAIGRALFMNTAFPTPTANVYIACFTVAPDDTGGGTEVSSTGTAYARLAVSTGTSGTGAGSGWDVTNGVVTNVNDLLFNVATASWGTVVSVGIFDAASGGNLLARGDLATGVPIGLNDQFKLPASQVQISVD